MIAEIFLAGFAIAGWAAWIDQVRKTVKERIRADGAQWFADWHREGCFSAIDFAHKERARADAAEKRLDERQTELLAANSREVTRRREAEARLRQLEGDIAA